MTLLLSRLGLTYQQARHQLCPAPGDETHPALKTKANSVFEGDGEGCTRHGCLPEKIPTTFSSAFYII